MNLANKNRDSTRGMRCPWELWVSSLSSSIDDGRGMGPWKWKNRRMKKQRGRSRPDWIVWSETGSFLMCLLFTFLFFCIFLLLLPFIFFFWPVPFSCLPLSASLRSHAWLGGDTIQGAVGVSLKSDRVTTLRTQKNSSVAVHLQKEKEDSKRSWNATRREH